MWKEFKEFALKGSVLVLRDGVPPGPYATLDAARGASAVTINYGVFTRACPQCLSTIPIEASRCAFCTSQIGAASA